MRKSISDINYLKLKEFGDRGGKVKKGKSERSSERIPA
jgi:hypothetical protein